MRWEPITPENAVARLSVATEHAISDFKVKYDTKIDQTKAFEIAKDVCAFANHLGGTIIVGAQEGKGAQRGRIVTLVPLTDPSPGELVATVDRAVKLYCLPVPIADAQEIPLDDTQVTAILGRTSAARSIVAINVQPALNTPIGCLACSDECKECSARGAVCSCKGKQVDHAYRFPVRTIESTRYLRPDELAKAMNITERRALLELQALLTETFLVWFNSQSDFQRHWNSPCTIVDLDSELMVCTLQLVQFPSCRADVPLVFVRSIWKSKDGWNVAIDGSAFDGTGEKRWGFRPPGNAPPAGVLP